MLNNKSVRLKKSPRARRLALRMNVKERIVDLVIPKGCPEMVALNFAAENREWIEQQIGALPPLVPFESGVTLPIFGKNYTIDIRFDESRKTTRVSFEGNVIAVRTNKDDPSSRIKRFLKDHAKEVLSVLVHEKAALIDKKVRQISIRDTSSRWGSCSQDGHISLSWRLIFAPMAAVDYVTAHEAAHLEHMNHSREFWELCERLSTDFTRGKAWMKTYGHSLQGYGA